MTSKRYRLLRKNLDQQDTLACHLFNQNFKLLIPCYRHTRETLELDCHDLYYIENEYEESDDSSASDVSSDESP